MTLLIGILLGGVAVIFALQNLAPVMVSFLGWHFEGSIALIVIIALLAGIIISLLLSLSSAITGMINESRLKRHNEQLKKELDDHKVALADAQQKIAEKPDTIILTDKTTI